MTIEIKSAVAAIAKPADVSGEPDMEAYAQARMSGKKIEVKPVSTETTAAATEESNSADATDATAATTEETTTEVKNPEDSATTENEQEVELEEKHPAKQTINKKFAKLTNKAKEAEALVEAKSKEVEQANAKTAELQAKLDKALADAAEAANAAIPVVKSAEEDKKPERANYDDPDEFAIALSQFAIREELRKSTDAAKTQAAERAAESAKALKEAQDNQAQAEIVKLHKSFNDRVEKAKESLPDFEDRVLKNEKLMLNHGVFFAIEKSELGPQILYHLANNPDQAETLNKLDLTNPNDALIRIGELQAEVRFAAKPVLTQAKAPVIPIKNRTNPERKTLEEMSVEEYAEQKNAKEAAEYAKKYPHRVKKN